MSVKGYKRKSLKERYVGLWREKKRYEENEREMERRLYAKNVRKGMKRRKCINRLLLIIYIYIYMSKL